MDDLVKLVEMMSLVSYQKMLDMLAGPELPQEIRAVVEKAAETTEELAAKNGMNPHDYMRKVNLVAQPHQTLKIAGLDANDIIRNMNLED